MPTADSLTDSAASAAAATAVRRPIYVAATKQHTGKTSVSLALISGLQKRFATVGFCKPVGQQSVVVSDDNKSWIRVDKDAALIKDHFGLDHLTYQQTSPVMIPPGYTRDYVDGKITSRQQRDTIETAYAAVEKVSDVVLCEGTGHCAVGSIVNASNAAVASWVDGRIVLVANGGLGKSFDELELNRVLCQQHGVEIAGVIVNMVKPEKYDQTKHYLTKALKDRWDVPLLGCVPDRPFLGCPALSDLERLFEGSCLVTGQDHRLRHYQVQDLYLVATSLEVFLKSLRLNPPRTLYVCHSSRNDILLGFLMEAQNRGAGWEAALVVTGCEEHPISTQTLEIVTSLPRQQSQPPVLVTPHPMRQAMESIHNYTPKLNFEDGHRVNVAVDHYEPYINFDLLLERVGFKDVPAATVAV
jgi:BioD-like phosphotransacetylase family protein